MATNNLTARKGRCINFGNCSIADTKEIIVINLGDDFVCSNPDCRGMLVEEKKQPPKKWILYAGIAVVFIGLILFFFIKSKVEQVTDVGKVVEKAITTYDKTTDEGSDIKEDFNESKNTLPSQEKTEAVETTTKPENGSKNGDVVSETQKKTNTTVKYDYGYYEGPTINDLPHGQGIMYFNEKHIINPKDPLKRYAEAGDYVSGVFHNGYLVNGKLYGKDKKQKEAIIIGQ
jgi:hypothetical protein